MKNLIDTQAGARGRAELFNQRLLHLVSLEKVDAKERSNPLNRKREKGDEVGHSNMLQQSKSFPIQGREVSCEVSQRDGHFFWNETVVGIKNMLTPIIQNITQIVLIANPIISIINTQRLDENRHQRFVKHFIEKQICKGL